MLVLLSMGLSHVSARQRVCCASLSSVGAHIVGVELILGRHLLVHIRVRLHRGLNACASNGLLVVFGRLDDRSVVNAILVGRGGFGGVEASLWPISKIGKGSLWR